MGVAICLLAAACGGDGTTRDGTGEIGAGVPVVEGARQVGQSQLGTADLSFAATDAVATLYVVDRDFSDVSAHYQINLPREGWAGGGIRRTESVEYDLLSKDDHVAVITLTTGRVLQEHPEIQQGIAIPPFDISEVDISDDETLVYIQYAACAEPTLDACMQKAFTAYASRP